MQEVFEKIIEKLAKEKDLAWQFTDSEDNQTNARFYGKVDAFEKAIEIVKQADVEYNNGWIPCSDHLPKENGYYYVTQIAKSISTGKKIAIEKSYVEFSEGEWRRAKHLEVIAWLDIEPYQPKGE